MGCGLSKEAYNAESGTESDYKAAFDEKKVLGQGEFGVVKLIVKKNDPTSEPLAVKVLDKGFVFKDNTLYTPMKPEVLKAEVNTLKELGGKKFNLFLDSVYESSSKVYVVTEMCAGGEMLEYTSKNMAEGLRTEDVSRIAYQLLSAVDHCDRHNILHRDIKPENIMFKANTKTAELRLIDFGCSAIDDEKGKEHVTFAGTPFYISPEMFQKKYTTKTDVFSVGVVLYVLVAGYPAESLQKAFNLLHKANRDLRTLPGMPEDMPGTYYDLLDKMLAYRWKARKSAGEMLLDDEFVLFHQALEGKGPKQSSMMRTQSVVLLGTGEKAAAAFGFAKFQRSVTTILAALLERGEMIALVSEAEARVSSDDSLDSSLGVINVKELKSILKAIGKSDCVMAIEKQKNANTYDNYSYDYTLLKPFTHKHDHANSYNDVDSSTRSVRVRSSNKFDLSSRNLSSSVRVSSNRKKNMNKSQSVYI
eukprot:CAMPEP_0172302390 /NCGR_PEP_ID=MMETSP1058-20130122/4086_1 /TAXON_ID=83371 /ORGANISM="Detonula confervacea, Strain CCMP 353" /LENGTH=474 /DNA_ID=CAMNT_0013012833 /DNA_START=120 /DNA_END=1544 /DNA_ORIENTATION=-